MADTLSIKVLGSGCPNCRRLEALAREVVGELGVDASVEHAHDFGRIAAYGLMATPGLVVNEVVKSAGRIPSKAEVTTWITTAMVAK